MNNSLATLTIAPILLIGGVILLLINIIYGLVEDTRGKLQAGWFTVGLALLACIFIGAGAVTNGATQNSVGQPSRSATYSGSSRGTPEASTTVPVSNSAAAGSITTIPAISDSQNSFAVAVGTLAVSTSQAPGTNTPRFSGTEAATAVSSPAAATQRSGTMAATSAVDAGRPGGNSSGRSGGQTSASGTTPDSAAATSPTIQAVLRMVAIGGLLEVVLALGLYLFERRRTGFIATGSRGLLNAGAGVFVVIAAVLIPLFPGQSVSAARTPATSTRLTSSATPSPIPTHLATATPLSTLTMTNPAIAAATLTPVSYAAVQQSITPTATTASDCVVSVTNNVNLRSDPSTGNEIIMTISAGTSLTVNGETKDKLWLQVSFDSSGKPLSGWVSAQYTTSADKCGTVPIIQPKP